MYDEDPCEKSGNAWEVILNDDRSVTVRSLTCNISTETDVSSASGIDDIVEEIVDIENITVKFRLSENQVIAQIYSNRLTLADIKKDIARRFEVDPKWLCLKQNGRCYSDSCMLAETCCDGFGIHEFDLSVRKLDACMMDDELPVLDIDIYYDKHRLPDFITVNIPSDNPEVESIHNVVVEIENKAITKPFLCGFKNPKTGKEYVDAYTQTGPIFDKIKYSRYITRDTQTHEYKSKIINTPHDQTTQCFRDGNNVLYVSNALDYVILPRKYQTAAQKFRMEDKCKKIAIIQRNWRSFLLTRRVKEAATKWRQMEASRAAEEERIKREKEKRISRENRVKLFPRTTEDFDLLLGEIQKWKQMELKRISDLYDGPARIAETTLLLDKEIQMLNGLERQKKVVAQSLKDYRDEKLLDKLGSPVKWVGYNDLKVDCDLLRTQRARYLGEIYKDLKKPSPKEERLEIIRKLKELLIIEEPNFPGFSDLFDLLNREKNLLIYAQNVDAEILHLRQNELFKDLIEWDETVEPKIKVYTRMCAVCQKVKPYSEFIVHSRKKVVDTCKRCYHIRYTTQDNFVYQGILRSIQREERRKRSTKSFAFILQQDDVRYIIDKIWHGHSILSKNADLAGLRLPRWIKSEQWAPWNCVCLTEQEARDHAEIIDLEAIYDAKLIMEVNNKHMLARSVFHTLAAVGIEFFETRMWWKSGMNRQRNMDPEKLFPQDKTYYNGMQNLKEK